MVLPATWSAALSLLILSTLCLGLWPNIFKIAGKYRFELFSLDFAVGAVTCALVAAFSLGTLGSDLSFSDSMLVAGRRAELMAVVTGGVFAFGNMLYLATIALMGLTNGTLLTFSMLGVTLSVMEATHGHFMTAGISLLFLGAAAGVAVAAARANRTAKPTLTRNPAQAKQPQQFSSSFKGAITGMLAGLAFACVLPVLRLAEGEQLGIGAYGGLLLATFGILISTFVFNFFFMNVSLEGGSISFSTYLSSSIKNHLTGAICGVAWAIGAISLYTACTGTAGVTRSHGWAVPFGAAALAVVSGMAFWQKAPQTAIVRRNKLISMALFFIGATVLLLNTRSVPLSQ